MESRNESEKLFEQYLDLNGFSGKWIHEPSIPGRSKRPDYLLNYNDQEYFFEVKELRKKQDELGEAGGFDPYASLRSEINEAREKFKEYKDYCCSLVVFNIDDWKAILDPEFLFGSMLGDLGIAMDFNTIEGKAIEGTKRNVFHGRGKMIDDKKGRRQNTTISAIVVIEEFLDNVKVEKALKEEEKKQGKHLTGPEMIDARTKLYSDHPLKRVPRVVVIENPYARIGFPAGLFVSPFDERWRWTEENGKIERVFAGDKLNELEVLKGKS